MPAPRILVVDDDLYQREGLAEILASRGFSVETAANGWEALELASRAAPSLILLDLEMPVMDGWELLSALRRSDVLRDIPVMVISGHADMLSDVVFLAKPVGIETLLEYVDAVVGVAAAPAIAE